MTIYAEGDGPRDALTPAQEYEKAAYMSSAETIAYSTDRGLRIFEYPVGWVIEITDEVPVGKRQVVRSEGT